MDVHRRMSVSKQYDDAKVDYTTAIEKRKNSPYTQAEAYVGRAEVNELTTSTRML